MRPLRNLVFGPLVLVLAVVSCTVPEAPADLAPAEVLLRCGVGDARDAQREASRALIAAARSDPSLAGSGDLIVAYRDRPRWGLGLFSRAGDPSLRVRDAYGLTLQRSLAQDRDLVTAPDPLDVAERLLDDPRVAYAHPDTVIVPHGLASNAPRDAFYGRQWNMSSFGLEQAWALQHGSDEVTLAVIDTGLDLTHPEFAGRIAPGWNFIDGTDDVAITPADGAESAHGTHVAGIAAATGGNGRGIVGVARSGVRLLPIRVFDDEGESTVGALADAIRWAAGLDVRLAGQSEPAPLAEPVHVINLSLGTRGYLPVPDLDDAIRDARRAGVVVIASVGNEGARDGVTSPANSPCAVAVASVDESYERSWFSNHDDEVRRIDLAAPGGTSTVGDRPIYSTIPGDYGYQSGTSMAAPFVSGAAALLWSEHPTWTDEQIIERLLRTAYLPEGADPMELGFGVACVDEALGAPTTCGVNR